MRFSWYVQGLAERSELNIDLKIPENFERLSPEMELVIFRLVQECLTNIHRHSGSKTALIRVVREADKIHVEVQDHGTGMSQERFAEVQSQGTGVGIRGMRERVRQVHGELTIESNALGTRIFATFPARHLRQGDRARFDNLALPDCQHGPGSSCRHYTHDAVGRCPGGGSRGFIGGSRLSTTVDRVTRRLKPFTA